MRGQSIIAASALLALAGCASVPVTGDPAVTVAARGETAPVGTSAVDAADDPAIWRNPANPEASLIVATDKKAGLYVYGLDGAARSFEPGGLFNNVDLVDLGGGGVIVAASDRTDPAQAFVRLYRLDTASGRLLPVGRQPAGAGEAYGICMMAEGQGVRVALILKDGRIWEQGLSFAERGLAPTAASHRRAPLATQAEGCVYDPRDGTLYVGEENAGIWRYAPGAEQGEMVAPVDNRLLVADVEGLALMPESESGGVLVASSQGDNAYAVFHLPDMTPVGRFRIAAGAVGATEETDGIALMGGDFGPGFPAGLFVAQDGMNAPAAQNFKLVRWDEVAAALSGR